MEKYADMKKSDYICPEIKNLFYRNSKYEIRRNYPLT